MSKISIKEYTGKYQGEVGELIIDIQHVEFGVAITLDQQPDLKKIESFYQSNNGNFWVALQDDKLVGTIALLDCGKGIGALRKMFVHRDFRGKEIGVGQMLLDTLFEWAGQKEFAEIYLGTIEKFAAARRFYEKNGFVEIKKENLPEQFPKMRVDTRFYQKILNG